MTGLSAVGDSFSIAGPPSKKFAIQSYTAHLRRIEPFIGPGDTFGYRERRDTPICESALPTWLEWTQIDRPRVPQVSVSIVSVE